MDRKRGDGREIKVERERERGRHGGREGKVGREGQSKGERGLGERER